VDGNRDIESLVEEAGLGQISKSAASRINQQLRARYQAFRARSLDEVRLLVLFLDATYLPTGPSGAKEGVLWLVATQPGWAVDTAFGKGAETLEDALLSLGWDANSAVMDRHFGRIGVADLERHVGRCLAVRQRIAKETRQDAADLAAIGVDPYRIRRRKHPHRRSLKPDSRRHALVCGTDRLMQVEDDRLTRYLGRLQSGRADQDVGQRAQLLRLGLHHPDGFVKVLIVPSRRSDRYP
jgi:hypothetical protein